MMSGSNNNGFDFGGNGGGGMGSSPFDNFGMQSNNAGNNSARPSAPQNPSTPFDMF